MARCRVGERQSFITLQREWQSCHRKIHAAPADGVHKERTMYRMALTVILFVCAAVPSFAQAKLASRFDFQENAKPCSSYGVILPKIEVWAYNLGSKNPNAEVGTTSVRTIRVPGGKLSLGGYLSSYFEKGQMFVVPNLVWSVKLAPKWNSYGNVGGYAPVTDDKWFVFLKEANLTRQCGELRIGVATTFIAKQGAPFPFLYGGKLEWKKLQFRALLPHGKEGARLRLFSVTSF